MIESEVNEYVFDMGNSNDGDVGYVAYVKARNPREAAKLLRDEISGWGSYATLFSVDEIEMVVFFSPDNVRADRARLAK